MVLQRIMFAIFRWSLTGCTRSNSNHWNATLRPQRQVISDMSSVRMTYIVSPDPEVRPIAEMLSPLNVKEVALLWERAVIIVISFFIFRKLWPPLSISQRSVIVSGKRLIVSQSSIFWKTILRSCSFSRILTCGNHLPRTHMLQMLQLEPVWCWQLLVLMVSLWKSHYIFFCRSYHKHRLIGQFTRAKNMQSITSGRNGGIAWRRDILWSTRNINLWWMFFFLSAGDSKKLQRLFPNLLTMDF